MNYNFNSFNQPGVIWVPCVPDYSSGTYIPIYNLSNIPNEVKNNIALLPRGGAKTKPWSHEEDLYLKSLIQEIGVKKWSKIAVKLNDKFKNDRIGKNCRERWNNHLNPDINKGEWSYEEDYVILNQYKLIGRRWSAISKMLNGRTENAVKNRWNTLLKSFQQTAGSTSSALAIEFLISHIQEELSKKSS